MRLCLVCADIYEGEMVCRWCYDGLTDLDRESSGKNAQQEADA